MNNLENILSAHSTNPQRFPDGFTESVMKEITGLKSVDTIIFGLWQTRLWKVAAACFVGCLLALYALDGSISVDSVLGLSEYSDIEISQSYQTYEGWDAEY
ncbi:MAG: hypothetical protein ACI9JN_001134 [Bacteroidia bacterium]|jgi:hypothetical protein